MVLWLKTTEKTVMIALMDSEDTLYDEQIYSVRNNEESIIESRMSLCILVSGSKARSES